MPKPTKPTDLLVTNGWYLEIAGLVSPHFETLDGLGITSNSVELVDAGTNKKHKFPTQILDFGELTLTRTAQNNADDATLAQITDDCIRRGLKFDCAVVKLHNQEEVFRILLRGFRITAYTFPTFDVGGEEKFTYNYTCTVDDLELL